MELAESGDRRGVGGDRLGTYDFSLPDIPIYAGISLGYILSLQLHHFISYFPSPFYLPCAMSANAEVPNAWEDDWESQADVSSPLSVMLNVCCFESRETC